MWLGTMHVSEWVDQVGTERLINVSSPCGIPWALCPVDQSPTIQPQESTANPLIRSLGRMIIVVLNEAKQLGIGHSCGFLSEDEGNVSLIPR